MAVQPGLCRPLSKTQIVCFLMQRLNYTNMLNLSVHKTAVLAKKINIGTFVCNKSNSSVT